MFRWFAIGLCVLLIACSSTTARAPVGERGKAQSGHSGYHVVRSGESLYSIAWKYGLDVRQFAAWNHISSPYTIYADQRLRLAAPKPVVKPQPRARTTTPVPVKAPRPRTAPDTRPTPVTKKPAVKETDNFSKTISWKWPAKGSLLSRFNTKYQGKKGISIAGQPGDTVRAAAAGKVVYAGSGLSGYGRLIIIKHNQYYLSAYAHNRKLVAREGEWVKANQQIAEMGNSGASRTQLYFEIRKNGAPVDPLKYLPRR